MWEGELWLWGQMSVKRVQRLSDGTSSGFVSSAFSSIWDVVMLELREYPPLLSL